MPTGGVVIAQIFCRATNSSDSGATGGDGLYWVAWKAFTCADRYSMNRKVSPDPVDSTGAVITTEPYSTVRICAPGNVRGWRNSANTALLNWDEPYSTCNLCPDAIGYEVYGEGIATKSVVRPPCEIAGLKTNIECLFYVTAKAGGNNISTPSPFLLLKSRPNKPGIPQVSNVTDASATLTWTPSTDSGEVRYRIYLNGFPVGQSRQLFFNLHFLRSSVNYYVEIRSINAEGLSDPAPTTFKTLLRAPRNLKLKHDAGTCRLSWEPYFLRLPTHEVTINGKPFTAGPLGFSFSLAELSPGPAPHHFNFTVYTKLDGAISETTTFDTTLDDVEPPTQPGKPLFTFVSENRVYLSWAPASDNTGVTGYRVVLNGVRVHTTADNFCVIPASNTTYYCVYVRAEDKFGNPSRPSERTVFRGEGPEVEHLPSPTVTVIALTSTTAQLAWSHPEDANLSIGVMIMINGKHYETTMVSNTAVLKNLVPGFSYVIEVFAFNAFTAMSEPTTLVHEVKDIMPPSVPGGLRKTDSTVDSITLAWDESTDDIGIYDYVICNNNEYFDRTPMTQYTVVDLLPGTYTFEVRGLDLFGNASEAASITVEMSPPALSMPGDLDATNVLETSATLNWTASNEARGEVGYRIYKNSNYLETIIATQYHASDLNPRTTYRYSVQAEDASGGLSEQAYVTFMTPAPLSV